jgi:hypothetical protein
MFERKTFENRQKLGYKQSCRFSSWGREVSVVARSTAKNPNGRSKKSSDEPGKTLAGSQGCTPSVPASRSVKTDAEAAQARRNGGWREIEARREKAALKASLADVWDEDFDLDEEILAELDHTAEFFTTQEDPEEEIFEGEEDEVDEYFEDDEV